MRSALDVNVLVSATIGPFGPSRRALTAWRDGRFTLVTSEHIVTQVTAKLRLPRIGRRYNIDEETISALAVLLRTQGAVIPLPPAEVRPITGDPEDDAVLATARLGGADLLVTGDGGLLALSMYKQTRIVTPRRFLDLPDDQSHS